MATCPKCDGSKESGGYYHVEGLFTPFDCDYCAATGEVSDAMRTVYLQKEAARIEQEKGFKKGLKHDVEAVTMGAIGGATLGVPIMAMFALPWLPVVGGSALLALLVKKLNEK